MTCMVLCEHANEAPRGGLCTCPADCPCRVLMCPRPHPRDVGVVRFNDHFMTTPRNPEPAVDQDKLRMWKQLQVLSDQVDHLEFRMAGIEEMLVGIERNLRDLQGKGVL